MSNIMIFLFSGFLCFLLNLKTYLQNCKECSKIKGVISVSNLLRFCPEKDSFLLTMIVGKFGDPDKTTHFICLQSAPQIMTAKPAAPTKNASNNAVFLHIPRTKTEVRKREKFLLNESTKI